ncbi:MAG: hypothetical protein RSC69_09430, partial [Lachnospiraceae bacterium]
VLPLATLDVLIYSVHPPASYLYPDKDVNMYSVWFLLIRDLHKQFPGTHSGIKQDIKCKFHR